MLRKSLPQSVGDNERIFVVLQNCETCPLTMDLPVQDNETGIPAVYITNREFYEAGRNVYIIPRNGISGVGADAWLAGDTALFIDQSLGTVYAVSGPFNSWKQGLNRIASAGISN
jgi:hypothetical protein